MGNTIHSFARSGHKPAAGVLLITTLIVGSAALTGDAGALEPTPELAQREAVPAFEEFTLDTFALGTCPEEPPLENFVITGSTISVPGFAQGEECAVILNAPASHYPIEITKVRIGWSSPGGGGPQSLEDAIRIYPAGLPNPGGFQYEIEGPLLTDGGINEFDLTLDQGTGSRIVTGGPFTVSLAIANTQTPGSPAPIHDGNGCQPGKNAVLVNGVFWFDACALGVSGDWVMSVSYRRVNCGPANDCNNNGIDDDFEIQQNPLLDCDNNGVLDSCQIAANPSLDFNTNGILDSCEEEPTCTGDISGDGVVNGVDLLILLNDFGPCAVGSPCAGDLSNDGVVNGVDLLILLNAFGPCPQ